MFVMLIISVFALTIGSAQASIIRHVHHDTTGDYISLYSVSSPAGNQGELAVTLDSSSALTKVSVHIYDSTGTTDLLDPAVTQSGESSGSGGQSTWTVNAPITQAQLPLGQYIVVVDAADAGGTTINGMNQAWYFIAMPHITMSASHTDISLANPTATVSGQVTLVSPDGTVTPYQGSMTAIYGWGTGSQVVTPDPSGDYAFTVSPTAADGIAPELAIEVPNGVPNQFTDTPDITFNVTLDPSKLTASLSSNPVTYGNADTLAGTLTYQPGAAGTYQPLGGAPVALYNSSNPYTPIATATTSANGTFSFPLPASLPSVWTLKAGTAVSATSLLAGATVSLPLNVNIGTVVKNFRVSLDQYWDLRYSGCVGFTVPISGQGFPYQGVIKIQWAKTPAGPWYTLASLSTTGSACGNDGVEFSGTTTAQWSAAYYRAYFPAIPVTGTASTGGGLGYHAAVSTNAYAWKYDDRITGFSVSPTRVNRRGDITVRGTLQYLNNGWRGYAGQVIYIIFRDSNYCGSGNGWCYMVKAKTNSRGAFSATFSDYIDTAPWAAEFEGNSTHLAAGTNTVTVTVR